MRIIKLLIIFLCSILWAEGKLKRYPGTWNRPFLVSNNITIEEYSEMVASGINNKVTANGLSLNFKDYTFNINTTMLGVTLAGPVTFENGVVASHGDIAVGKYAGAVNRTEDLTAGIVYLNLRLTKLKTLHDLKSIVGKTITGTVETDQEDVHVFYTVTHNFKTNKNDVTASLAFDRNESWTIKPRDINTYIIEETAKRQGLDEWYRLPLEEWCQEDLIPIILEIVDGLPFPISPY